MIDRTKCKYRIAESNGNYQPQKMTLKITGLWLKKTSIEWIPIQWRGSMWFDSYQEALEVIERYKKPKENKVNFTYID